VKDIESLKMPASEDDEPKQEDEKKDEPQ
jgi:hypothetical protein